MSSLINTFIVTISTQSHNGLILNREIRGRKEVLWVELLFDLAELLEAARIVGGGWFFESGFGYFVISLVECFTNFGFFFHGFFYLYFHELKVAFLAAADESFAVAFEFIPAVTDVFCFIIGDGVILSCTRDTHEQGGELGDDFIGGREYLEAFLAMADGISHEVAIGVLADVFQNAGVSSKLIELYDSVERVSAT